MRRLVDVNVMGTFYAARAALAVFRRQEPGHIIAMSSIVGRRGIGGSACTRRPRPRRLASSRALRAEFAGTNRSTRPSCFRSAPTTEFHDARSQRDFGYRIARAHGPRQPRRRRWPSALAALASCRARGPRSIRTARSRGGCRCLQRPRAIASRDRIRSRGWQARNRRLDRPTACHGPATARPRPSRIARAVRDAGGRALVVGGWVRDRLLGRDSKDLDLEVFGVPADRLRALLERLGRVDTVGESFTVYKVGGIDVSLPRRESKTGRGHEASPSQGDPSMSLAEAARRRDFTINAIVVGSADRRDHRSRSTAAPISRRRLLRVVDPATFGDDSLRVLRALQFAARFELDARRRDHGALPTDRRSTICRPSGSGARSRSCCCRPRGRRSASRWRSSSASSIGCCPSCARSSAVRRSRSGIRKATSGSTR